MGLSLSWVWPVNLIINKSIPDDRVARSTTDCSPQNYAQKLERSGEDLATCSRITHLTPNVGERRRNWQNLKHAVVALNRPQSCLFYIFRGSRSSVTESTHNTPTDGDHCTGDQKLNPLSSYVTRRLNSPPLLTRSHPKRPKQACQFWKKVTNDSTFFGKCLNDKC